MKQIPNPEYKKWCRELRNYSMDINYVREMPIDDRCTRIYPFPTNFLTNPRYCDNEQIQQWIANHPMPAKTIDDPEYVAMQNTIKNLEKRCDDLEHAKNIDMSKLLREWHEHNDALSIEDVQFIIDKLLLHMRCRDTLNIMWSVADEDKHYYTDKGLETPFSFNGADEDYRMSMLSVYIDQFLASRNKTREQRYYECLQADIDKKLKDKE